MTKKWLFIAGALPLALGLAFTLAVNASRPAAALPDFVDDVVTSFGASVSYSDVASLSPTVSDTAAIATARRFTSADRNAVVRTIRLAVYTDPLEKNVPVWVIDIDGLSQPAISGGIIGGELGPTRTTRRAVVVVYAARPDSVLAMMTTGYPGQ